MKQTLHLIRAPSRPALVCLMLVAALGAARAEDSNRAGRTEVYGFGQYMIGDSIRATSAGITAEIEPSIFGGGIGVGYNFSDHWNLNADVGIGAASIEAKALGVTVKLEPIAYSFTAAVDYNILKSSVTPFLTAGGGIIAYEGDGVSEQDWLVGAGAGIRWDITDKAFAKLMYRANFTEIKDAGNTVYHTITLSFGIKF